MLGYKTLTGLGAINRTIYVGANPYPGASPWAMLFNPYRVLNKFFIKELIGFLDPVVGLPLGDEDAVGGGDLGLLDEGAKLVATEFFWKTVNQFWTAGVGTKVDTFGL